MFIFVRNCLIFNKKNNFYKKNLKKYNFFKKFKILLENFAQI